MLAQPPMWFIVLAFLLAIGPLVFLHELGHYLVARLFGIGAQTFSIGFGNELFGWTDRRGTRWKVGWLPLGGYVRFVGDMNPASQAGSDDTLTPQQRKVAFHLRPVWQRFLVVLAGPLTNFLLAIAIFAAFFATVGYPRTPNLVSNVAAASPAASAGIKAGDRIVSIAGRDTSSFEEIAQIAILRPGELVSVEVERDGARLTLPTTIGSQVQTDRFGQRFRLGRLGVYGARPLYQKLPATQLVPVATTYTAKVTRSMVDGLWQIISGRRSVKELGGPLKMAQIAGQQASLGLFEFIQLIALFSINLGFINLLPVPMLDGGHLAFYGIEAVQRRPVSGRAQEWAFRGGLALLLALLLFTTANDLLSFGLFDRLGRLIG